MGYSHLVYRLCFTQEELKPFLKIKAPISINHWFTATSATFFPGSNCLALLAVYRWVSDLCDLGHYGALGFSTWAETMSCLIKLASKCPPKKPFWCFGVGMSVCHSPVFFSEYLYLYIYRYIDSIFSGGFHQESHTCVTWTQCCDVFSPKKALEMSVDAGTLSTLSALNCMAGGSLDPSLVLLDSILNAIAIWGMFQNGVGSQKRLMFK